MLYTVDKFNAMNNFDNRKLYKFFKIRYREVLQQPFNEEQLYYFFAIKIFNFQDILTEEKDAVLKSNNQILISYYLKDHIFEGEDINELKEKDTEGYWFQNYHLILYLPELSADLENSINKYLIPKNTKALESDSSKRRARKEQQRKSYMDFYKDNIELNNPIIRDIEGVHDEIIEYLTLRIEESQAAFEEE